MTLSTTTNKVTASGNGVTTVFSFSFPVLAAGDLVVIYTDTTGSETVLNSAVYSTTGVGATSTGGTVTYPLSGSPIATGTTLTIMRTVTLSQGTSITSQGSFDASVLEAANDYDMMALQQVTETVNRAIRGPAGEGALAAMVGAALRANKYLLFDASGNPSTGATISLPSITVPISIANGGSGATSASGARTAYGSTTVGDALFIAASAAAARTAIGTVIGTDVQAFSSLLAFLNVTQGWTAAQQFTEATLTDASPTTWNLQTQQCAKWTLGASRTLSNPTNMTAGRGGSLQIIQDGGGSRVITWSSAYLFASGVKPTLSTAAGSIDLLSYYCTGTAMICALIKAAA